ncbi:MAG: hypothetical protein SFT81_04605 [Candidatus Caenarcaniphilales bacterium]|nr:hypothetical protein [Candidatus Caenarcaniphilales bacterium]
MLKADQAINQLFDLVEKAVLDYSPRRLALSRTIYEDDQMLEIIHGLNWLRLSYETSDQKVHQALRVTVDYTARELKPFKLYPIKSQSQKFIGILEAIYLISGSWSCLTDSYAPDLIPVDESLFTKKLFPFIFS